MQQINRYRAHKRKEISAFSNTLVDFVIKKCQKIQELSKQSPFQEQVIRITILIV
jgi:hypothetical protein